MLKSRLSSRSGFTLLELLIIISLIALLAAIVIALLNPWAQIAKAWDSKRVNELAQLNKVFEDFYNDKGCYPKPDEVCYPSTQSGYNPQSNTKCYVCGNEASPTNFSKFSPYLARLPCDPQHPNNKLLYQVNNLTCPSWYKIYSELSVPWSLTADVAGCGEGGCGVAPNYGYDYGASSPNVTLDKTSYFYGFTKTNTCDNCSGPPPAEYNYCYTNPVFLQIYPSEALCCASRTPKPIGCP